MHRSGPVLLYAAEEPMPALHSRLHALARNHALDLALRVPRKSFNSNHIG